MRAAKVNAAARPFMCGLYGIFTLAEWRLHPPREGESDKQPRVEANRRYGSLYWKRHITAWVRWRGLMTQI
jgi:hypothetical protein